MNVELVNQWVDAYEANPSFVGSGIGAVIPAPLSRLIWFREGTETASPPHLIRGDAVLLDATNGWSLKEDGGGFAAFGAANPPARAYLVGKRTSAIRKGLALLATTSELTSDGGEPPLPDGGRRYDAGLEPFAYGDVLTNVSLFNASYERLGPIPVTPLSAAQVVSPDGGARVAMVFSFPGGYSSLLTVEDNSYFSPHFTTCDAFVTDALVTDTGIAAAPDERIVSLTRCRSNPSTFSVVAWSTLVPPVVTSLPPTDPALSARMGIAAEGVTRRAPYVAWLGISGAVSITKFNPKGTVIATTRTVVRPGSLAAVGAVAVDGANQPVVLLNVDPQDPIIFEDLPSTSIQSPTGVLIAGFDEQLRLRWVGPLKTVGRIASRSATFVGPHLIVETWCPGMTGFNRLDGGYCSGWTNSAVAKLVFADGGQP